MPAEEGGVGEGPVHRRAQDEVAARRRLLPRWRPYLLSGALHDITSGSNGTCTPAYLCTAGTGYDGPTGLGTPNGILAS